MIVSCDRLRLCVYVVFRVIGGFGLDFLWFVLLHGLLVCVGALFLRMFVFLAGFLGFGGCGSV